MRINWNHEVKLILADVDETIADVYMPADKLTIKFLEKLLQQDIAIFLISGGGLKSICERVAFKIQPKLRKNILISHCSGSEVWGFKKSGDLDDEPFYSVYEKKLSLKQRNLWRKTIRQVIDNFKLETHKTMPVKDFIKKTNGNPRAIMLDDRGPQITFEVVNGYDLNKIEAESMGFDIPMKHGYYDMRFPIAEKADELFSKYRLPVDSRVEAVFAINFAVKGVNKEMSVKYVLENENILRKIGLSKKLLADPLRVEIWGDDFSELRTKHDSLMCRAAGKKVRAIDFRQQNPKEFPEGYNINVWDGEKQLHEGLLEYLQTYVMD